MHDYLYDINHLKYKPNEFNQYQIKSFTNQLDSFLSKHNKPSLELDELTNMIINLLKELVGTEENQYDVAWNRGYDQGYEDCEQEDCNC